VGLENKDFHILNRQYPRKRYFEIVKQLKAQVSAATGARSPAK
jgi:hypothetical protein